MLKIGCVSLDVSHPLGFAANMQNGCMDMRYEYVWDNGFRKEEEAEWFVKKFKLKAKVDNIADMVDYVDIGFIHSCNWEKHLDQAMPFIEKNKPVFIDKPIVGSKSDIRRLKELIKNGAKIMGSSSARYADEIKEYLSKPVEERGEILSIFGTCGVDEFNYGIHIVEILSELAGSKAVSCRFVGEGKTADGKKSEIYSIKYENGIRATYHSVIGAWHPFHISLMTTKGTVSFIINSGKIYMSLLKEIYNEYMRGKSRLADIDTLINCTETMLCGKKSKESGKNEEIKLNELCDGDKFDGYSFEKEYGEKSTTIYKD